MLAAGTQAQAEARLIQHSERDDQCNDGNQHEPVELEFADVQDEELLRLDVGDIGGNVVATGHRRVHSLDRDSRSSRCQQVHGRAGDGLVRAERDRGNGEQQRIQQARRSAGEDDRQDHDRCADGDRQEFHDKCAAECADDHDALKADVDDAGTLREAAAQGDEKQDRGKDDRILDQQCHFCAPPFCSSASLARAARRSSPFRSEACRRSFRKPLNAHRKMMRLEIRLEICGE